MPFTRTQSILKKLLPKRCFRLLHDLAYRGYEVWLKTSDELNFLLSYVYYVCTRDSEKAIRIKTIHSICPYTMVGRTGLLATYDVATEIEKNNIEGCFVECGVAQGGCSALMAIVAARNKSDRKTWLFDSFEGLPKPTEEDPNDCGLTKGSCLGAYDEVSKLLFSKLGLDRDNVFMVKGWFQDTLPKHKDEIGAISLLRIDADWYESTKRCLENLYDNVVVGGYIVIDDYGTLSGCKKAVDMFLKQKHLDIKLNFDNRGGIYFVKPYQSRDVQPK